MRVPVFVHGRGEVCVYFWGLLGLSLGYPCVYFWGTPVFIYGVSLCLFLGRFPVYFSWVSLCLSMGGSLCLSVGFPVFIHGMGLCLSVRYPSVYFLGVPCIYPWGSSPCLSMGEECVYFWGFLVFIPGISLYLSLGVPCVCPWDILVFVFGDSLYLSMGCSLCLSRGDPPFHLGGSSFYLGGPLYLPMGLVEFTCGWSTCLQYLQYLGSLCFPMGSPLFSCRDTATPESNPRTV